MNSTLGYQAIDDGDGFLPAQNSDQPLFSGVFQTLYMTVKGFTD
jgi:hypothetical protein